MTAVRASIERDGQLVRLTLAKPKGNILDAAMVAALRAGVAAVPRHGPVKLVVIDHDGPHFSFGASVEEHLPEQVADMLGGFHALLREIEAMGVPTAAIVRGQCLGGGLELALVAGRIFADDTTWFGMPEVKLGVFPPAGTVLLPLRARVADVVHLVCGGQSVDANDARAMGICDQVNHDANAACLAWFDAHLATHSAPAIRHAWRAARRPYARALGEELAAVERMYLDELMSHRDPVEGLTAFVQRRTPTWEHA